MSLITVPILGDIIGGIRDLVGEAIVDKDKRNEIELEITKIGDAAEQRLHEQMIAQAEINKVEAASGSVFVAGWRPAVGWVCAAGLAAQVIVLPLVDRIFGWNMQFDTELLILTMSGMLGIGAMRTVEKIKGVSTNDYTDVPSRKGEPTNILPPIYGGGLPEKTPWE